MFNLICLEYKTVSIPYFMDEMQMNELNMIMKHLQLSTKQDWEQTRLIAYITAQTKSTKKLKPTDIIKFEWDETANTKENKTSVTKEDVERLTAKAQKIIELRNQK